MAPRAMAGPRGGWGILLLRSRLSWLGRRQGLGFPMSRCDGWSCRTPSTATQATAPCPYNTMRNGARWGGRSAYSKPGGYTPKCFPSDVTAADIAKYRAANGV